MTEYTLVQNDQGDWIGLYKDGLLIASGHSFSPSALLRMVGIRHDMIWDVTTEDGSDFPNTLDELIHLPGAAVIRTVEPK